MPEKKFEISENFANEVMRYLAERPYAEVWQYIEGFKYLKEIKQDGGLNITLPEREVGNG